MSIFDGLYWRQPAWLLLTLLPPLALALAHLWRRHAWRRLADPVLLPWLQTQRGQADGRLQRVLLWLTWALLGIALAGPRTPAWVPPTLQAPTQQLVAVIDYSASMRVRDGRPDRVASAVQLLLTLVEQAPPQLRIGLVIYAGEAHSVLPPSHDRALLQHYLQRLPALQPPTLGNDLAGALHLAQGFLGDGGHSTLLVLSDGDLEDAAIAAADKVARQLAQTATLHWIGIGGDELAAVPRANGDPLTFDGRRIASRRQADWMQALAAHPHMHYHAFESLDTQRLATRLQATPPRIPGDADDQVLWNEHFALPLLAGVGLLLLALQLSPGSSRSRWLALLAGLWLGGCQLDDDAADRAAMRTALQDGDYATTRQLAARLDGYTARYAEGIACYRLQDHACAVQAFSRAAWNAEDDGARGAAAFNLGLAYFRLGDYEQAAVLFRDAELLGVDADQCRLNRTFAESLAAGVRRWLDDIAESERRAAWRAAAGQLPAGFGDRLANDLSLSRPPRRVDGLPQLVGERLQALLQQGAAFQLGATAGGATPGRSWVESQQLGQPGDTAQLLNALMSMEAGLPLTPPEPLQREGRRPW